MKSQNVFKDDKVMQKLYNRVFKEIGDIPEPEMRKPEYYFSDLCESIISQQLSTKVADVITKRVKEYLNEDLLTPESILKTETEDLRKLGISYSKISYMKSLAEHWLDGSIKYKEFDKLSNEEIISELVKVKGIGQWTAEMFLMFTLNRPDVFSAGDLGLKTAIIRAY